MNCHMWTFKHLLSFVPGSVQRVRDRVDSDQIPTYQLQIRLSSIVGLPLNSSSQSSQEMRSIRWSNDTQLLNPSISSSHDRAYTSASFNPSPSKTYQQHHPSPPLSRQVRTQHPTPSYSASSVRTRAVILARIQIRIWPFRMIRKWINPYRALGWIYIESTNSSGGLHPSSWMKW